MTAKTDLMPLVGTLRAMPEHVQRVVQSYARANVAHAVAPLQAEIEALRAEVARLVGDAMQAQAEAKDFKGACEVYKARAERLAEALRLIESAKERGFGIDYARGVAQSVLLHGQEEGK